MAAAVLVLLLVGGLMWLVSTFDANAYKGLAVDWVKEHRDRTLVIGGPVKLSVFPRLTVELSDVTLSEKGRADEFAALNQMSLSVALLPLLSQRLEVDRVSARGLRLVYRRNDRGESNVDDLLSEKAPRDAPEEARAPGGQAMRFDVQGIEFDDLRLSVRDDMSKVSGEIGLTRFSTGRLADQVESPVALDAQLTLKSPAVQGRLSGKSRLTLDLAAGRIGLRDTQLKWRGDVPGVRALDAQLKGSFALDTTEGTATAEAVELQGGAVLGGLRLSNSQLRIGAFRFDPRQRLFDLEQLALKVAGTQDRQPLALTLDWPGLSVKKNALRGSALSGKFSLEGPKAIDVEFKSSAPTGTFEQLKIPAIQADIKGVSGPRRLAGTLGADMLLRLAEKTVAIDALKAQLNIQEPALQAMAIGLQGRIQASPQTAGWTLNGDINSNPFHTEGQARLSESPMSLRVAATFKALDLNRLLLKPVGTPDSSPGVKGSPAGAIDLSALGGLQGRFTVRIADFAYQAYRVDDAALDATLSEGVLKVSRLTGRAWSGTFDATGTVDSRSNRFAGKALAQNVNVNALLKDVAGKDVLEGTGRVSLDVDSAGRTVGDLKARLGGSASLQLRDGAIKGVNLAKTLRQARAALSLKQDAKQAAMQSEKTDFSEMSASFAIRDGMARNDDLMLKSPFLRVGGDGSIDIARDRIDYTVRATVAETSKGQDGAELAALRGVTIPVRLTGALNAIDWTVQWSAVAANVLKSEAGQQLQNQLKDRLRDKLGVSPPAPDGAASAPARPQDALKEKLLRGLFK